MRFLPLDKLINVQEGYRKRFKIDSTDLILSKEKNQIVAFGAVCPHQELFGRRANRRWHHLLPTTSVRI